MFLFFSPITIVCKENKVFWIFVILGLRSHEATSALRWSMISSSELALSLARYRSRGLLKHLSLTWLNQ